MWQKHSLVNGSLISLGKDIWLRLMTNSLLYKEKHSPAHVTPHKKDQRCPAASRWVSSCTNSSSWKMQQETQPVPSSWAGSRAASSAAPSSSPLLITGKEFALRQIKPFTRTKQPGSDSSSAWDAAFGCHAHVSATRHCCRARATHAAAQRLQPHQNSRGGCLNTPTRAFGQWLQHNEVPGTEPLGPSPTLQLLGHLQHSSCLVAQHVP